MSAHRLDFDAVAEARPGPKWKARWERSWPAYEAWFVARGGDRGPDRAACEAALRRHMPELVPVHAALTRLAGGGDRAARFLATWCPPRYLGGCSLAAAAGDGQVRLVRNYDLSPDLNEGLLLRSAWTGTPVMGMVEFLWGLSDGINGDGLSVALAYGGRSETAPGFGVTTILRYVLETCATVKEALAVLERVPSHMAYNLVLADASGAVASVELIPGGGVRRMRRPIATNHQHGDEPADRPGFTRTLERHAHLSKLMSDIEAPRDLAAAFLEPPLFQTRFGEGFGTLFTAEYRPERRDMALRWPGESWRQRLDDFREGRRTIRYDADAGAETAAAGAAAPAPSLEQLADAIRPWLAPDAVEALGRWVETGRDGQPDWSALGALFAPPPGASRMPRGR